MHIEFRVFDLISKNTARVIETTEPSRWNSQCPMVQLSETQVNKRKISNVSENSLSHRASSMFKNYSMYFVRENVYERVSSYFVNLEGGEETEGEEKENRGTAP